ncbi:hypothetical protein [Yersinia enterocolitica]
MNNEAFSIITIDLLSAKLRDSTQTLRTHIIALALASMFT